MDYLLGNPLIALFAAIGAGMALGRIQIAGLSLGSSGVLFAALLLGHLGYDVPQGVGAVGLVLFVYCVGIGAGGRFFAALARQGSTLAIISLIVVGSGALLTGVLAQLLSVPADLAAGIFAGAMTSTPALAAATDLLKSSGPGVPIGYGISYPLGVIGVVIFVQLLPRLLKKDLQKEGEKLRANEPAEPAIVTRIVEVTNPNLEGKRIAENDFLASMGCQITRVLKNGRLVPLEYVDVFAVGQELHVVGREDRLDHVIQHLGKLGQSELLVDVQREQRQLIVTHPRIAGKRLREANILREHHVVVSRITRLGIMFVPNDDTIIERNDILTSVGSPEALQRFSEYVGHRSEAFDETDLLSIGAGITAGVIAGLATLAIPGGGSLSLGLAGGPLLVGLLLGHFGRVGRIVGHIPRATRLLLQEMGLVFFLADAGIKGGRTLVETINDYGLVLFGMGAAITFLPIIIAFPIARKLMRLNLLQTLGGLCGGMTSTPALGALTAKTDSQIPVVSYATAYPVALILMTFFVEIVVRLAA